jgi:uncharacterized Zn-binding protein involved in type VI secretion
MILTYKGAITSGHGSFPPSPIEEGSSNVNVEGKPCTFKSAIVKTHINPSPSPCTRSISSGSSTVNINGHPAARISDSIDCGGMILQGNSTVFCG